MFVEGSGVLTQVIGWSSQGYPLEAFVFGRGPVRLALIGGIHGGYEWNTILLAYQMIDYLSTHPESIPPALTIYVVPAANPDGQVRVTGVTGRFTPAQIDADTKPGRLNGNGVDVNRNWDCRWSPTGMWGTTEVSGGSTPMSEPETQALAVFLTQPPMDAVIFWHSAMPGVFAGGCDRPLVASETLARTYAAASGYPFQTAFTSYIVTGNAVDWLSGQGIPAIDVELNNHQGLDWGQNLPGVLAILRYLAEYRQSSTISFCG